MTNRGFPWLRILAVLLAGCFLPRILMAQAPGIVSPPQSQSVMSGTNVTFPVVASGAAPLAYQWRLNGTNIADGTNASLFLPDVRYGDAGAYTVIVTNQFGAITSPPAILILDEHLVFRVLELQTNGAITVDHNSQTGDDRNCVAVTPQSVFVTGDSGTMRASAANLSGGVGVGSLYDALVTDLRTEKLYSLAEGTNLITTFGGQVTALVELDPVTGARTPNVITLSEPISVPSFGTFSDAAGIFAGYGRVLIWARFGGGNIYEIAIPSGRVTDLGFTPDFFHQSSEGWAFWGLAEYFANQFHIVFVEHSQSIARRAVGSFDSSTQVASFLNLSDMAGIALSTSRSRWYFHHEGTSQFRPTGGGEILGSAKALYSTNAGFPAIYQHPESQTSLPDETVVFSAVVSGSAPLSYQWHRDGVPIPGATGPTLTLTNVQPDDTGTYYFTVSNSLGSATSGGAFLFVIGAPEILSHPQSLSVLLGTNASFGTFVQAAPPIFYQWLHNGTNIPNATNSTYEIPNVTTANAGSYQVQVTNRFGSALSSVALLSIILESPFTFRVLSLSNDAVIVDHSALTGDDLGGIAVSSNRVFVTGDGAQFTGATATFAAADLSGGALLPSPYFALVTDLRTEQVFSLGDGTNLFLTTPSTIVTTLIGIDGTTGARTGTVIPLSEPIEMTTWGDAGLFSGYGQVVLHTGWRVYSIAVPSGTVTQHGEMGVPSHQPTESWAYWGIAEHFNNALHLVYVQQSQFIVRTRVPDGLTTSVANFVNLADMASIGASVSRGRWYFRFQDTSEFGGTNQSVGYASARFSVAATPVVDHFTWEPLPAAQFSGAPFSATITARTIDNVILSNFSGTVSLRGFATLDNAPVNVLPNVTASFTNGVWAGQIVVPEPVGGMYLRAADLAGRSGVSVPFAVVTTNDLAVQVVPSTNSATLYAALTYRVAITNTGPGNSSAVVATNVLPAGATLISAAPSQGSCGLSGGALVCNVGSLPAGASAQIEIIIVPTVLGTLTNTMHVARAEPEGFPGNNTRVTVIPVSLPVITISDASTFEGDSAANRGTNIFTVELNTTSAVPVTVQFATRAGTASNTVDYVNRTGTLTFAPGVTSTNVRVTILAETRYEPDEVFFLYFSNAVNAVLDRQEAVGTIFNDDPVPSLVVTNTLRVEGNSGTSLVTITARLSNPSANPISVGYFSSDGTARAGVDYTPVSGQLDFVPGSTEATFIVPIMGDTTGESNEFFSIEFQDFTTGAITQMLVVILNDDPPGVDHFEVLNVAPTQFLNTPFFPTIVARDFNNEVVSSFNGQVSFALGASEIEIGTGEAAWNWPFSTFYEDARVQTIYLASEIGNLPTRLTSLSLRVTSLPPRSMANWVIRMKHTSLSSYNEPLFENTGWTVVYQSSITVANTGWVTFDFTTPFDFNGVNNLMVDLSFDDTFYVFPDGEVSATPHLTDRSVYARCDSCNGDPKLWTTFPSPSASTLVPDVRFGSIGGALLTPTISGAFTNGVWSGPVRALAPIENVPLIVLDSSQNTGVSIPITVVASDDLSVRIVPSASPSALNEALVYSIIVSNSGPAQSTGVFLTNQWPAFAAFLSASTDRGTVSQSGTRVIADIGALAAGQAATVTVAIRPSQPTNVVSTAVVRRNELEDFLGNNAQTNIVLVTPVTIVSDSEFVMVTEGDSGTTNLFFSISIRPASTQTVSATWFIFSDLSSGDGATPGVDFAGASGSLVFPPGVTNRIITVPIIGDTYQEPAEFFTLEIQNPTNAVIQSSNVLGVILDDDPLPMISINDVSVTEGNAGLTEATLTLTLSEPSSFEVFVWATTLDGTATGWLDFVSTNMLIIFAPGQTSTQITVHVMGETEPEPHESFIVLLNSPSSATIAVAEGRVTILNDEVGAGELARFEIANVPSPQTVGRPVNLNVTARNGVNGLFNYTGPLSISARSGANAVALSTNSITLTNGTWTGAVSFSAARTNVVMAVNDGAGHSGESNPFNVNVADLRISASTPPEALIEFPFDLVLTVSNSTANAATAVTITNVFSSEVSLVGVTSEEGACFLVDKTVSCDLGALAAGESVTITVALTSLRGGSLTNNIAVRAFEFDPAPSNNVVVHVLDITGDADGDGLPDSWETQVGLSSENPADAHQDLDGDRHSNLQEYVAGTDPADAGSVLKASVAFAPPTSQISFMTVSGRRYRVESAPGPVGPWTSLGNELLGEGDVAVVFDPAAGSQSQRFYRVLVLR